MTAVGLLVIVMSIAGVIFRVAVNSHRMAAAHAEILQKLRIITTQLDADFDGLLKDQEIFVAWVDPNSRDPNRFDRIMFFSSTGDFQAYHTQAEGDVARISYMIANDASHAYAQPARERVLARTQHIMVSSNEPAGFYGLQTPESLTDAGWFGWHNHQEIEGRVVNKIGQWKQLPADVRVRALRAVTDIDIDQETIGDGTEGTHVELHGIEGINASIHKVLCEGVGQFRIQGWYEYESTEGTEETVPPPAPRWVPEMDVDRGPDGDSNSVNGVDAHTSDFFSEDNALGYVHWSEPNAEIYLGGEFSELETLQDVSLDEVPGLGRALRFTFTLYDSKGVIQGGRTYSHIVYLDK
jgi:hypothetical protein